MQDLIIKMTSIGLEIFENPILDSRIHRLKVSGKNKKNGWYLGKVLDSEKIFCLFGRWDTSEKIKWKSGNSEMTKGDLEEIEFLRKKYKEEKEKKQKISSDNSKLLLSKGDFEFESHPYLDSKGINHPIGFLFNDIFYVPMYKNNELVNLQRIYPNGTKKFLPGGMVKGCYAVIKGADKICICEGYATGASINMATGYTVIIAFQANNLKNIAEKNKGENVIICGDNDESGTGEKYGREASNAIGAEFRMPPVVGWDFNDMHREQGLDAVKKCINRSQSCYISKKDIPQSGELTLEIPEKLYSEPDLISLGMEACSACGEVSPILQYNFPVVLSYIARAIAGKIEFRGQWPVFYNIKVGRTNSGKTGVDTVLRKAFMKINPPKNFYGPTEFSSGPGLERAMSADGKNICFMTIDEATELFKRFENVDMTSSGKLKSLLTLYTNAGVVVEKAYSDSKNNISIKNPCLILVGNATESIFAELRPEDFETGTLTRFDFWCWDGPIPYRSESIGSNPAMDEFLRRIKELSNCKTTDYCDPKDLRQYVGAISLDVTPECRERISQYSREVIDLSNAADDDTIGVGIISRRYDLSQRYALLHIAATRNIKNIADPMELLDIEWGISMAEMLTGWKLNKLSQKVISGKFHKICEVFKDALRAVLKSNNKPTRKLMTNRRSRLKDLNPQQWDDVVRILQARDEIAVDESGKNIVYNLIKDE